jgi:hypothetical protein
LESLSKEIPESNGNESRGRSFSVENQNPSFVPEKFVWHEGYFATRSLVKLVSMCAAAGVQGCVFLGNDFRERLLKWPRQT